LLNRSKERFTLRKPPEMAEQYRVESRLTAFRRIVVEAYRHTCVICGIRIVTPEGRTKESPMTLAHHHME